MSKSLQISILVVAILFFIGALAYYFYVRQRAYRNDLYLSEIATISQSVKNYGGNNSSFSLESKQLIPVSSKEFRTTFQTPEPEYCKDCVFYHEDGHFWIFGNIPYGKQCWETKRKIKLPNDSFSETDFLLEGRKFNCWVGE